MDLRAIKVNKSKKIEITDITERFVIDAPILNDEILTEQKRVKITFTYLILYCYSLLMFKPVWPVLFDKLAHLCWEYEHMQVAHQHDGIYHVDQELRDEAEKSKKENNNSIYKFQVLEYPHIISENKDEFCLSVLIRRDFKFSLVYPHDAFRKTDYPPPKA